MSLEAEPVFDLTRFPIALHDLGLACQNIQRLWRLGFADASNDTSMARIEKSGLAMLVRTQPIPLYSVAQSRETKYARDRIYGIMQVFGFRLGASSPNLLDLKRERSLLELEEEFGQALLDKWPVLSQLYLRMTPTEHGEGWRISSKCKLPAFALQAPMQCSNLETSCQFSTKKVGSRMWAWVEGFACPFRFVQRAWSEIYRDASFWRIEKYDSQMLELDYDAFIQSTEFSNSAATRGEGQRHLATAVLDHVPDLKLLFLDGVEYEDDNGFFSRGNYYGLVVESGRQANDHFIRRLGVCHWSVNAQTHSWAKEFAFLRGQGSNWKPISGMYG